MKASNQSIPILRENRYKAGNSLGMIHTEDDRRHLDLVNKITEDEDDRHAAPNPILTNMQKKNQTSTESFLQNYGTMMKQQETEYTVTLSYLRPLLRNLELLAWMETSERGPGQMITIYGNDDDDEKCLSRELTYAELRRALEKLEKNSSYEYMTADSQFMLALRTLTSNDQLVDGVNWNPSEESITWAEFVQCYRVCIVGMQALEKIPQPKDTRARARDRSLLMMRHFQQGSGIIHQRTITMPKRNRQRREVFSMARNLTMTVKYFNRKNTKLISRVFCVVGSFILSTLLLSAFTHPTFPMSDSSLKSVPVRKPSVAEPISDFAKLLPVASLVELRSSVPQKDLLQSTTLLSDPTSQKLLKLNARAKVGTNANPWIRPSKRIPENGKSSQSVPMASALQQGIVNNESANIKLLEDRVAIAVTALSAGLLVPALSSASAAMAMSVPALISIGATVVAATLVAHGLRGLISNWFNKYFNRIDPKPL